MKIITEISEIHHILLQIANEFDKICLKYSIPYYMLGGTMLGAIRHKGFIPWDDDMDFGVPRPYYEEMITVLEKELPKVYRCCTFENTEGCITPFVKIADMRTVIDDPRVKMPLEKQIGVNIDIFPLDNCKGDGLHLKMLRMIGLINRWIYVGNAEGNKWKSILKRIASKVFPISPKQLLRLREIIAKKIPQGDCLANSYGRYGAKEIVPLQWYGKNCHYKFEDIELCGIENYDAYLKQLYGDYRQMPPEKERIAHVSGIYER